MRLRVVFVVLFLNALLLSAQSNKELANKYLESRGELVFTFTAKNSDQVKELANIVSFDHGQDQNNPLTINAYANKKEFKQFLAYNLPYTIDRKQNDPKEVVMFDPKIHKKGISGKSVAYPLSFPLTAYPTYQQYASQMAAFAADHPSIAQLVDIGGTSGSSAVNPRLLFIKLSDNVLTREQEPRVMYTSSMHGDEIAGYPSMLNLINYFITAYEDVGHSDHTRVKNLLDNSEVWINPMANPDGTFYGSSTYTTVSGARRANANGVDLNRNYPDNIKGAHYDGYAYQAETVAFMNLADNNHFVLSANFHGGTEVVNYPWDNTPVRHPDDSWYFLISKEYAVNCQNNSSNVYMEAKYTNYIWPGVTNGSDWYTVFGGRQDYMNFYKHSKESTIELSDLKTPPSTNTTSPDEIIDIWNYNKEAYIEYLIQGTYGFRGVVKDATTGNPIKAKVTLVGHDALGSWVETELFPGTELGDYYRPINAGTYSILFEADCYQPVTLTNQTITNYQTIELADVMLTKSTDVTPSGLVTSNITNSTAIISWNSTGGSSYNIRYRNVGNSNWTNTSSSTASFNLSGLTANTDYEFQVQGLCNALSSPYSSLSTFKTVLSYCNSSGDIESRGITNVAFKTINKSSSSTSYQDFTSEFTTIERGNTSNLSISGFTAKVKGQTPILYVSVFIDFNGDGDFLDSGEIFNNIGSFSSINTTTISYNGISIPIDAKIGSTRMRISAKGGGVPSSCETGFDGEVEDYTINIIDATLGVDDELLSTSLIYPNPVLNGELTIEIPLNVLDFSVTITNAIGQQLHSEAIKNSSKNIHKISTVNYKPGIYFVTISTELGKATKKLIIQ